MEVKKSAKADLEGKWLQRFLLGVVVSTLAFFAVLYFPLPPEDDLDDPEILGRLSTEEELAPLMRTENEISLAPKAKPEPTMKLKVVEEEESEPEEETPPVEEQVLEGDAEDDLPEPDEPDQKGGEEEVVSFRVVEDLPQPPGGYGEFMKWLTRNLKYPENAQQRKLQGKVVATFIVNKDGSVTDVNIVKSLTADCDQEAMRVLRMMPRWTPGVQNDKPCRTQVCIPIIFKM